MKVYLAASGDARETANRNCWPTQSKMEKELTALLSELGISVERIHSYDEAAGHGFLDSQKACLEAFRGIDRSTPMIIAESVWQYSHHVLPGLLQHAGPILTLANWSGQWPGLVGLLNLNGCLIKAEKPFSTMWVDDFSSASTRQQLKDWLDLGSLSHDISQCQAYSRPSDKFSDLGRSLAKDFLANPSIMGVFDEGCMGMYNAIIPDELLFPLNVYKERLSQSELLHQMSKVPQSEAEAVLAWLEEAGMTLHLGADTATELTKEQVIEQCRMYIAALRMADQFGCSAIGIQYQLGLVNQCAASDLAEGLLNNSDRPPVENPQGEIIAEGKPFVHFNEVDECAGLDAMLIQKVHAALDQPLETTLHDLRWADADQSGTTDETVWVLEISGAAPPAHHIGGYAGTHGYRQPAMYFPQGGATCAGIAKPGEIVWSRVFVKGGQLCMDIGRASVLDLPEAETKRRLEATTKEWPSLVPEYPWTSVR